MSSSIKKITAPLSAVLILSTAVCIFILGCKQQADSQTDLISNSVSLVSAIETYTSKNGMPESLDQLVPDQLNEVPNTGIKDAPAYLYNRTENDWSLEAVVPRIPTRTVYLYRSSKDYSDCAVGKSVHQSYKIIEATPKQGWMILREQTN